ncbi:MAG: hypothetical protein JNL51_12450 [Chitinophagaceae bacterium]|nr:hypothetical protein [Chitinophagaceae bacterium]
MPAVGGGVVGVVTGFEAPAVFPAGIDREALDEEAFALPGFEGLSSDRMGFDVGLEELDWETPPTGGFEGLSSDRIAEEDLRTG